MEVIKWMVRVLEGEVLAIKPPKTFGSYRRRENHGI